MGRDERRNLTGLPGGLNPAAFGQVPIVGAGQRTISHDTLDILGRPLREGDAILIQQPGQHPMFVIKTITRAEGQNISPGLMEVRAVCEMRLLVVPGQRTQEIIQVLRYEDRPQTTAPVAPPAIDDLGGSPA